MSTGLLDDIITYIDNGSTRLTVGRTLFMGGLPDASVNVQTSSTGPQLAVVPQIGFSPIQRFVPGGGAPAFVRPQFRVITRSTAGQAGHVDGSASYSLAEQVCDLLDAYPPNSTVSGGVYGEINSIASMQRPFLDDHDENGRWIWAFNVLVWA